MIKPTLVIMAAGLGSRYGGLKQIDPVGPNGEIIMEYSIFDALKAGFSKVVFIIKEDIEKAFREKIGKKIEFVVDTEYVFQRIEDLPEGYTVCEKREKPWGTAHAVFSSRNVVDTPFAVINADDFYGRTSFEILHDYLVKVDNNGYEYCLIGFILENTLSENGHVARGVCSIDLDGYLIGIEERTKIKKFADGTKYTEDGESWITIPKGSIVSMNTWGFTPTIFKEIERYFPDFLEKNKDNLSKAEYFLPSVVDNLIKERKAKVKVLRSEEKWYGVTYKEDKAVVEKAIKSFVKNGIYPKNLWEDL